jgi:photosystem II stability/assembly factor-like uncharacterized protein
MRKLLLLLPLILGGCNSDSDDQYEREYQAPPSQVAEPGPVPEPAPEPEPEPEPTAGPGPEPGPVFDLALYVPMPAIVNDDGWTARLKGLPVGLNDVVWSGEKFIAVGEDGVILTSENGIDWVQQVSGTNAGLANITSDGPVIVVVGHDGAVLLSTDHGENWTVKYSKDDVNLKAVVINDWQIVVGGRYPHTQGVFMMRSEDLGDTWMAIESFPRTLHWTTDLVYAGGLFVASTDIPRSTGGTRVWVSVDGKDWQDILLWDDPTGALGTVLHDGNQFVVAGSHGAVFVSSDGAHWERSETPLEEISYGSAAWNGSELVLAGGITWWYWWVGEPSFGPLDVGLSSSDGGQTWSTFNIDGYFESRGMAWGNGRFVSVGKVLPGWGEGAIYTSP